MLSIFFEVLFKGIGYTLIVYAFWLLVGNSFYNTYVKTGLRKYHNQKRIKRLRELEREEIKPKKDSFVEKHLRVMLASVSNKSEVNVSNFVMLSIILLFITTIILYLLISDMFFAIIVGLIVGITPYFLVLYKLETIRNKTSHAFMNEFHIILQNYQSTNKNIYYMLLNTVEELEDKNMKRQFRKLISSFQKERQDSDFRNNVHIFVYSINSTFAKRFGNLLIKAHLENANIGQSLSSLNDDITSRKKSMEDEKTEKLQTIMIGFAPIFVLPMMVWFAYQVTGALNFWHFFIDPINLTLFIICVICSIISVLLAFLIRKPKADA